MIPLTSLVGNDRLFARRLCEGTADASDDEIVRDREWPETWHRRISWAEAYGAAKALARDRRERKRKRQEAR